MDDDNDMQAEALRLEAKAAHWILDGLAEHFPGLPASLAAGAALKAAAMFATTMDPVNAREATHQAIENIFADLGNTTTN